MKLDREWIEELIYGSEIGRRFTQDSPVLPDVWIAYAEDPLARHDLLLTPLRETHSGQLSLVLQRRVDGDRKTRWWQTRYPSLGPSSPLVAYNETTVSAWLSFEELVRVVLPLTRWWADHIGKRTPSGLLKKLNSRDFSNPWSRPKKSEITAEFIWMMRLIGTIALAAREDHRNEPESKPTLVAPTSDDERLDRWKTFENAPQSVLAAAADLLNGLAQWRPVDVSVFSISMNREATPAVLRSVPAIKGDAATRLFALSCADLTWAVIDSGIDASHPAFRKRDLNGKRFPKPFAKVDGQWENRTRILKTYDFSRIRYLLTQDPSAESNLPKSLRERFDADPAFRKELRRQLSLGRQIDWTILQSFLEVSAIDGEYEVPRNEHGTHVAGILAGHWTAADSPKPPGEDVVGVCPDINLYDLRVLDENGEGSEFSVMAALQFIRHLNASVDFPVLHGANISLAILHDVANYACGRTPVCEECERVVATGVTLVAAAGNQGYQQYLTSKGPVEGYLSISITDPGNAEAVITVGSTHRYRPHMYGVSYFSSRGPTGDGRQKPDLVAPGEKITASVPGGDVRRMDGTSMAAPHVSGAAALLIARHRELVGHPAQIKQILCDTATDLGRERYFQGAGMVDILRAIQSV
jgi:serine protease AprX